MHRKLLVLLFWATAFIYAADDAAVIRARSELARAQDLVSTGVLPQVKLEQAQNALADAEAESTIRALSFQRDITVDQAAQLVTLTKDRVERRQRALDARQKLLDQGIIAKSEIAEYQVALDQANADYKWAQDRAAFAAQMVELAKTEQELMRQVEAGAKTPAGAMVEHFRGSNHFEIAEFAGIEKAFERRFAHPLPVSAMGETETHKALGFDHRNRVDVALVPDQTEGKWLRGYLTTHDVPYFAFRAAVPGKATGAHIHIGPPSDRYIAQAAGDGRRSGL